MCRFANEDEWSAEVQKNLAAAFDLAQGLFNFWLTAEKDAWVAKTTLPPLGVSLAMMLDVQALRLFRSVVEQCERCEGFCACIL